MSKQALNYLVIQYVPSQMSSDTICPAKIDGHFARKSDAEDQAKLWAEQAAAGNTRVVVVEVVSEFQRPTHWEEV